MVLTNCTALEGRTKLQVVKLTDRTLLELVMVRLGGKGRMNYIPTHDNAICSWDTKLHVVISFLVDFAVVVLVFRVEQEEQQRVANILNCKVDACVYYFLL